MSARRAANLGKLLGFLITQQTESLFVLKTIEWGALPPAGVLFVHTLLVAVLGMPDDAAVAAAFAKLAARADAAPTADGLTVFVTRHFVPAVQRSGGADASLLLTRVRLAQKALDKRARD